MKKMHLESG